MFFGDEGLKGVQRMKDSLVEYQRYLENMELSVSTVYIYMRYARQFVEFAGEREITKALVREYRNFLEEKQYKPSTMNLSVIAVNCFLKYCGKSECVLKTVRIQRRQSLNNVLTKSDYQRLLQYAREIGDEKYFLLMRTLATTGIRVSELSGITVETLVYGYTQIMSKGKVREIYIPDNLSAGLKNYCEKRSICKGAVFQGNRGTPISRGAVWKMLKHIADMAGVQRNKVYPHSFRHFFAQSYMNYYSNIFELADILGHSNIETTRIYSVSTVEQKRKRMGALDID